MTQQDKQEQIDFFYKEQVIKKHNGKIIAYYLQPDNIQAAFKFLTSVVLLSFIVAAVTTFNHFIDKSKEHQQEYAKQIIIEKQNIIKGMTQKDLNDLIKFLDLNKEYELNRLNDIYWKLKFIDSNFEDRKKINSSLFYSKINDIQKDINIHYDDRKVSFISLYSKIKANDYSTPVKSYDGKDTEELFKDWHYAQVQNNFYKYNDIDTLEIEINKYLTDKLNIAKFMEANKADIEKTKKLFQAP